MDIIEVIQFFCIGWVIGGIVTQEFGTDIILASFISITIAIWKLCIM